MESTGGLGITWLFLRKKYNNKLLKTFKFAIVAFAIFVLVFDSLGIYLSYFSGPVVPHVDYPNVLNNSLTPYLQTLEQSPSFQFFQSEHLGSIIFESLSIHTIYSNAPALEWRFYVGDVNSEMTIGQSGGVAYSYGLVNIRRASSLPQSYPSNSQIIQGFNQIDLLGLNWFFNKSVAEYQNATGGKPDITDLTIGVGFDNVNNYQGITIVMNGLKAGMDNFGGKVYPTVFWVEFQPNGTIVSTRNSLGL